MKITTQQELEKLIATADESNTIVLDKDLEITFDCVIPCNIKARDITVDNINVVNIKAHDIIVPGNIKVSGDITVDNIVACDIKAHNINVAWNIKACNIDAHDIITDNSINAHNIIAGSIKAHNIEYHAFCIAHQSLKCKSISGRRKNSFHKCLDQEIEIVKKEEKVTIELTQEQIDKINT